MSAGKQALACIPIIDLAMACFCCTCYTILAWSHTFRLPWPPAMWLCEAEFTLIHAHHNYIYMCFDIHPTIIENLFSSISLLSLQLISFSVLLFLQEGTAAPLISNIFLHIWQYMHKRVSCANQCVFAWTVLFSCYVHV